MAACRRRDGKPKIAHETQDQAEQRIGPGENAYRCTRCDSWHVGHTQAYARPQLLAKYRRAKASKRRRTGAW